MDSSPKPRQRARKANGKYKGDNPETKDLNEAWVPTDVEAALPKEKDYSVKKLVEGTSQASAGKYGKKPSTRPTFGTVTTTTT
jgi:hypothetical protein